MDGLGDVTPSKSRAKFTKVGDYELPNLNVPIKQNHIGKYGMLHRTFIKQNHPTFYTTMLMQGTLLEYLEQLDRKAQNRIDELIVEKAKEQGVTEILKAENQMLWVGLMNNIKNQAEEIVYKEMVYNRIVMKYTQIPAVGIMAAGILLSKAVDEPVIFEYNIR